MGILGKKTYHYVITEIRNGGEYSYACTIDENTNLVKYIAQHSAINMFPAPNRQKAQETANYLNSGAKS